MCEALKELFHDELVQADMNGFNRGRDLGFSQGRDLGFNQGHDLGFSQGMNQNQSGMIRSFLSNGGTRKDVFRFWGITDSEIDDLLNADSTSVN